MRFDFSCRISKSRTDRYAGETLPKRRSKPGSQAGAFFWLVAFFLLGIWLVSDFVRYPVFSSQYWPVTSGTVQSASWSGGRHSSLHIAVAYNVAGKSLVCNKADWSATGDRPGLGMPVTGQVLSVWANPQNAAQCVLHPGMTWGIAFDLVFGLFALCGSCFGGYRIIKRTGPRRRRS